MSAPLLFALMHTFERARAADLPAHHRLVLLVLADFADDAGKAWPSAASVATRTGQSRSTVETCLAELEAAGWLVGERRKAGARNLSTVYLVHTEGRPVARARTSRHTPRGGVSDAPRGNARPARHAPHAMPGGPYTPRGGEPHTPRGRVDTPRGGEDPIRDPLRVDPPREPTSTHTAGARDGLPVGETPTPAGPDVQPELYTPIQASPAATPSPRNPEPPRRAPVPAAVLLEVAANGVDAVNVANQGKPERDVKPANMSPPSAAAPPRAAEEPPQPVVELDPPCDPVTSQVLEALGKSPEIARGGGRRLLRLAEGIAGLHISVNKPVELLIQGIDEAALLLAVEEVPRPWDGQNGVAKLVSSYAKNAKAQRGINLSGAPPRGRPPPRQATSVQPGAAPGERTWSEKSVEDF